MHRLPQGPTSPITLLCGKTQLTMQPVLPGINFSDTKWLAPTARFGFPDYQAASTIKLIKSMYKPQGAGILPSALSAPLRGHPKNISIAYLEH